MHPSLQSGAGTEGDATEVGQVYCLADAARKYLEHVFVGNC